MQLDFVASVVEAAARADLDVLLSPSGGDHDGSFERMIAGRRVDGVVLMEIRLSDPRVGRLERAGMPFVTIGRTAEPGGAWWVDVDYATLIGRCVDHLADLGHRDLALINRSAELTAVRLRTEPPGDEGFADASATWCRRDGVPLRGRRARRGNRAWRRSWRGARRSRR